MKKIISLMLTLLLFFTMIVPVSAVETKMIKSVDVSATGIVVKGNTGNPFDNVIIAIIKEGVSVKEIAEIIANTVSQIAVPIILDER